MDLTRRPVRRWLIAGLLTPLLGGCSSSDAPFELNEGATELPSTLLEAHTLAEKLARDVSPRAYVTELGGRFSIMDENGRSRNHSFVFHSIEGQQIFRRILVDLVGGAPWVLAENVGPPPPRFSDLSAIGDSDLAVAAALNLAEQINTVFPDSIPIPGPGLYAARIRSTANWPENSSSSPEDPQVAWRVDFLIKQPPAANPGGVPVPWTTVRFYFTPSLGTLLQPPIVRTQSYVDRP